MPIIVASTATSWTRIREQLREQQVQKLKPSTQPPQEMKPEQQTR